MAEEFTATYHTPSGQVGLTTYRGGRRQELREMEQSDGLRTEQTPSLEGPVERKEQDV